MAIGMFGEQPIADMTSGYGSPPQSCGNPSVGKIMNIWDKQIADDAANGNLQKAFNRLNRQDLEQEIADEYNKLDGVTNKEIVRAGLDRIAELKHQLHECE